MRKMQIENYIVNDVPAYIEEKVIAILAVAKLLRYIITIIKVDKKFIKVSFYKEISPIKEQAFTLLIEIDHNESYSSLKISGSVRDGNRYSHNNVSSQHHSVLDALDMLLRKF